MKRIIIIPIILLLIFISSCKTKNYIIYIQQDDFLSQFYDYELSYESDENGLVMLPEIQDGVFIKEQYIVEEDKIVCKITQYKITINEWLDEENNTFTSPIIKEGETQTVTLSYTVDTIEKTINFSCNNLELESSSNKNTYILPTINNQNFDFGGWYYNELFLGKPVVDVQFDSLAIETNLYAKLTPTLEYVNNLINDLPEKLTIFDITNIETAKKHYNKLSYQDKQLVENYEKLQNAYTQIEDLKIAYDLYNQLVELYDKEITSDLKKELDMLLEILETCEDHIKKLIPNLDYEKLESIVNKVNDLYKLFAEEAVEFDKKIAQIPIFIEQYYENEIYELYEEYQALDINVKVLLNASKKLETLYQNLQQLNSKDIVYYFNTSKTNNIYTSKKQLFEAFFTDFYYYIAAYHGLEYLENNKLNNVTDFVTLAGDFTGAGANNLYGIGNIAGRYMLEKDINGILENQTEKGFFGFCYKNNLYQDVLPFFINFFAYWRIDEKYANTSNYGADIFAESWAPTVDIAKFFYYDENTSYVKTERMIDCLTNTASVAYGFNNELPTLKLRGYIFEGWYDNPEYSGNKLTSIDNSLSNKLYAKWSIDQNQVNSDAANLVDIYIYNLTTSKAVVNNITVGYVKTMYDNLTQKGKQLVNNYSTLQQLLTNYK